MGKQPHINISQKNIGNSMAYRAVANANAANPIPIIVPCHRVILINGNFGDYGGGKELKQELIQFEKENTLKS